MSINSKKKDNTKETQHYKNITSEQASVLMASLVRAIRLYQYYKKQRKARNMAKNPPLNKKIRFCNVTRFRINQLSQSTSELWQTQSTSWNSYFVVYQQNAGS